jgi:beta-N-acetylhexosaminidase
MNLRQQVGQLIIAGLEGPELTALERAWLKLIQPGGVILFRRNIEEPGQVVKLLSDVAALTPAAQFRCIDLEGGLVDRLRDLIAPMPSPAAVFAMGKRAKYEKHGRLIGQEVRALGFNTIFAPVLDLALPVSAEVMRTRVVSPDAVGVVAYADAFLDGLGRERVIGCGKHFPGLGGGTLDSHHAMPVIERGWEELWNNDLAVFRALAPRLPMVMVAHASYPLMKDTRPASISRYWISDVLRKKIGFKGLIISDDMEMGGILTQASIEEAAVEAIAAGTDIIEICRDPSLVLRGYEALLSEAERSTAFRRRVEASSRRILSYKRRHLTAAAARVPSSAAISRLRLAIERFAKEVAA